MTVPVAPTLSLILVASPLGFQMLRTYLGASYPNVVRCEEDGGKTVDEDGIGKSVLTMHFQGSTSDLDDVLKDTRVRDFINL